jgi:GT2 family glycosyltransferase
MPKLSIVIPTYTINKELNEMAYKCAQSYRKYVDDLIICEDGGNFSEELMSITDSYIYNKNNVGFTKNVNRGWKYAQGDYVAIVSSDTYLVAGDLNNLCIPGKVTSPIIENQNIEALAGPFFVTPKSVTKKIGYLNEKMKTYYSDTEYDNRTRDIFQKVLSVIIKHDHARTVTAAGVEGGEENARDGEIYKNL